MSDTPRAYGGRCPTHPYQPLPCPMCAPAVRDSGTPPQEAPFDRLVRLCDENLMLADVLIERLQKAEAERDALRRDSEILRRGNIVEIAVANETGSVSEYMKHWESRALKAETEVERLRAEGQAEAVVATPEAK